ncbi:MAG TPA: amidohydrolase family protein [Steroidobacteraceae bacterium]|nr:amidohydrolase family protein [Steroidobacteraceae bacterium]
MPLMLPTDAVDLLIEARWLLPMTAPNTVLIDHAVAVADGKIAGIGPSASMRARFKARARVVREQHALLPGFVNAHTRAATTLLRGLPAEGPRGRWLHETLSVAAQHCSSPDFVREGTQLAIAEMLRAGITSFADLSDYPEESARVAASARVRAAIALPVADEPTAWADSATAHFGKAERMWDEYRANPWVSLYFAPHATCGDESLVRVRRVADELDARVAMQIHESDAEVQYSLAQYGWRPLRRLQDLGLLQPGFTAIQLNRLDEEDLDIIGRSGVAAVACPQSNLRLGSGSCPVARLHAQQTVVGFGSDYPASAGALDILAEARAAALLMNGARAASAGLSSHDVLHMATLGGATALGLGSVTGSMEPGKAADLVCVDLGALACQPVVQPHDTLVFSATREQVSDVWVAGRAAVENRRLLAFDEQELVARTLSWAQRLSTGTAV